MSVPSIPPSSPVKWGASVLAALKNALNAAGGLVGYSGNVGAATGSSLALSGLTLSASGSFSTIAGTWNNAAVVFPGAMLVNVTNTASAAGSLLADFQIGGVSKANFDRDGQLTISKVLTSGGVVLSLPNATSVQTINVLSNGYGFAFGYFGGNASEAFDHVGLITVKSSGGLQWVPAGGVPGLTVPDLAIVRDAAGILAQRNGTNAQSLRVYNTWSSAGANYERGILDWTTTANVLTIGTEMGGTGVARNLQFEIGNVVKLDYGVTTASTWTFVGTISAAAHRHPAAAIFPASPVAGDIASVNTATAPTIGSAVALGGAAFALGVYNGAQWTCIGK